MKATGIVRRIDDLGRVVIPKEIRRTLRLREGTPLEIFTDREGEIILKKYSPMVELAAFAVQYAEAMAQSTGLMVCIADRDQIIAIAEHHLDEGGDGAVVDGGSVLLPGEARRIVEVAPRVHAGRLQQRLAQEQKRHS